MIISSTRSRLLNRTIELCQIEKSHSDIGTEIEIGKLYGHQKRLKAKVVPFPFYDLDLERMRS